MARSPIPFPVRHTQAASARSHDSLARDTQHQACRIADRVENEISLQAMRCSTGLRASRVTARVLTMPAVPSAHQARKQSLLSWLLAARTATAVLFTRIFSV